MKKDLLAHVFSFIFADISRVGEKKKSQIFMWVADFWKIMMICQGSVRTI
jgi:hypothetical protein